MCAAARDMPEAGKAARACAHWRDEDACTDACWLGGVLMNAHVQRVDESSSDSAGAHARAAVPLTGLELTRMTS